MVVYLILVIAIAVCGAVMVVASMDPEGRGHKVANNSFYLAALAVVVLVILVVLDVMRWISTF